MTDRAAAQRGSAMSDDGERKESPRVRRARARAAVSASKGTGDILPREIYEIAEVDVPPEATDEIQRAPEKKKHWWSRKPEQRRLY